MNRFILAGILTLILCVVIIIAVLVQGRPINFLGIRVGPAVQDRAASKPDVTKPRVRQSTQGDNSPAVQGVDGDVNIKIDSTYR